MYHPLSSSILLPPRTRFLPTIWVVSTSIPPPNPEYPCISCWKICGHGCFDWPEMGSGDDQMPHGSEITCPQTHREKKTEDFFADLRTESLSLVNCCKREKLWTNQKASAATCNLKSCQLSVSNSAFPAEPIWFDMSIWGPKCRRRICGIQCLTWIWPRHMFKEHSLQERNICCGILVKMYTDKSSSLKWHSKKHYHIATRRNKTMIRN